MRGADRSRALRMISGIMAVMMLVIVLLSSFYVIAEADHRCTGEDCPVCAVIRQCENTIRRFGALTEQVVSFVLPVMIVFSVFISAIVFQAVSPVSRKVRLNN